MDAAWNGRNLSGNSSVRRNEGGQICSLPGTVTCTAHCAGIHSRENDGNQNHVYEGTPESSSGRRRPRSNNRPARKGSWVRIVVYLVLVAALGLIVWKIYQNQKLTAANSASQAAALMSRPVPVQVTAAEQKPMPIYLTALGTVTPYMSVTVKARVSGAAAAGEVHRGPAGEARARRSW